MAIRSSPLILFCLLLPAVVTMAVPLDHVLNNPCQYPKQNETNLHMYLHQFPAWPNVKNPNEALMVAGGPNIGFGQMYVNDWIVTAGPDPNEKIIARAQGFHLQAGQTSGSWYTSHILVFQDGSFAGSTLQVLGLIADPDRAGQWAIIGGTGSFTNAHGTINYKTVPNTNSSIIDAIRELDIHVFYTS